MTLLLGALRKSLLAPRELPRVPQPHGSTVSGAAASRAGVVAPGGGTGWWHIVECMPWSTEAAAEAVMPSMDPRLSLPLGF